MSSLDVLLSVPVLNELVDQFPSLTEPLPVTQLYMMGDRIEAPGDRVYYDKIANDRRLGAVRTSTADSFVATRPDRDVVETGMIQTAEKEIIPPTELFEEAGPGRLLQRDAERVVLRAVKRIMSRLIRTREFVAARLFQDSGGVTLNSSNTNFAAGANTVSETVDIDGSLQQFAVGAAWDLDTTKVISGDTQLTGAMRTFEANGQVPWHMLINREVARTFPGNIETQTWLTANGGISVTQYMQAIRANAGRQGQDANFDGSVLNGLGGIPFWHIFDHGYTNRSGTFTRYLDDDIGVFLPEDLSQALAFAEGPVYAPGNVIGSAEEAHELFDVRTGMSLYAYLETGDVPNVVIVGRDNFRPIVTNELGVLNLTGLTT